MTVAIIDYGSGNLHSVRKAVERAALESGGSTHIQVTSDPDIVSKAERVILPGVGAFKDCRQGLLAVEGLSAALEEAVLKRGRPVLGICVGMQLMASLGVEHVTTQGLGWIDGKVVKIAIDNPSLKIPHMGWNTLDLHKPCPLFEGIKTGEQGSHAYFVHSYHLSPERDDDLIATVQYGGQVTAMVQKGNIVGVQFHPEKSQALGLKLLGNFLSWTP